MTIPTVGLQSDFPVIAAAMTVAGPGDTVYPAAGYSNETAPIAFNNMIILGATAQGIVLNFAPGMVTMTGTAAPIGLTRARGLIGCSSTTRL